MVMKRFHKTILYYPGNCQLPKKETLLHVLVSWNRIPAIQSIAGLRRLTDSQSKNDCEQHSSANISPDITDSMAYDLGAEWSLNERYFLLVCKCGVEMLPPISVKVHYDLNKQSSWKDKTFLADQDSTLGIPTSTECLATWNPRITVQGRLL
jgi:hypothetical protein